MCFYLSVYPHWRSFIGVVSCDSPNFRSSAFPWYHSRYPISKSSSKLTETYHAWTKRTDYCWRGLGKAGVLRSQNHVQVVSSTEAPDVLSNDSEKPGKASETRTVLGKLHAAGKSPEITCENAGNPRKIAADTRNSVGDATGKALSAAEITCESARKSAKGKSMESKADSRVDSVEEATETDARSALP